MSLDDDAVDRLVSESHTDRRGVAEQLSTTVRDEPQALRESVEDIMGVLIGHPETGPDRAWSAIHTLIRADRQATQEVVTACANALSIPALDEAARSRILDTLAHVAEHHPTCLCDLVPSLVRLLSDDAVNNQVEDLLTACGLSGPTGAEEVLSAIETEIELREKTDDGLLERVLGVFMQVSSASLPDGPAEVPRFLVYGVAVENERAQAARRLEIELGGDEQRDESILKTLVEIAGQNRITRSMAARRAVATSLAQGIQERPRTADRHGAWESLFSLAAHGLPEELADEFALAVERSVTSTLTRTGRYDLQPGEAEFRAARVKTAAMTKLVVEHESDFARTVVEQLLDVLRLPAVCGVADICATIASSPADTLVASDLDDVSTHLYAGVRDDRLTTVASQALRQLLNTPYATPVAQLSAILIESALTEESADQYEELARAAAARAPEDMDLRAKLQPVVESYASATAMTAEYLLQDVIPSQYMTNDSVTTTETHTRSKHDGPDAFLRVDDLESDRRLDAPIALEVVQKMDDPGTKQSVRLKLRDTDESTTWLTVWETHNTDFDWIVDGWYVFTQLRAKVWEFSDGSTSANLNTTNDTKIEFVGDMPPAGLHEVNLDTTPEQR